ncbi:MAG: rhodanese-like domain-containing protein [Candidatus Aminicenantes bacterium]
MSLKKMILRMAFILLFSSIIGLGANFSLIKRFFSGEFQYGFFSLEEYSSVVFITLGEAEELFATGSALFIDSRATEDFKEGHIFGAVNIPFVEKKKKEDLNMEPYPLEGIYVVYCDANECQSSVELAKLLHENGFQDIRIFFGGWEEWVREGLPVSREDDWK